MARKSSPATSTTPTGTRSMSRLETASRFLMVIFIHSPDSIIHENAGGVSKLTLKFRHFFIFSLPLSRRKEECRGAGRSAEWRFSARGRPTGDSNDVNRKMRSGGKRYVVCFQARSREGPAIIRSAFWLRRVPGTKEVINCAGWKILICRRKLSFLTFFRTRVTIFLGV